MVSSLLKRWTAGTLHYRLSYQHMPYYLDEFTFRFNRRNSRARGMLFYRLLQQAVDTDPHPLKDLIGGLASTALKQRCRTSVRSRLAHVPNPSKTDCNWVGTTGTSDATFEGTPLVIGQSAPDPGVLAGIHGPAQTCVNDLAAPADSLCLVDLAKRRVAVADREEQLWILVQAGSTVTPSN